MTGAQLTAGGGLVLAALGAFLVVFGEGDDAPGAQLLGVLLVVASAVLLVRGVRRGRRR